MMLRLLIVVASLVAEHGLCYRWEGFSNWQLVSSVVMVHCLNCPMACGIFPSQGLNLCLLYWQLDSLPLPLRIPECYILIALDTFKKCVNCLCKCAGGFCDRYSRYFPLFLTSFKKRSTPILHREAGSCCWLFCWVTHPSHTACLMLNFLESKTSLSLSSWPREKALSPSRSRLVP